MSEKQNYSYKKTEWKNDETHLNASNMNNMEYGIDNAINTSNKNARDIEQHDKTLTILTDTTGEVEGSVTKTVRDAKKEVIGEYSQSFEGVQQTTIASTVEYFQGEVNSINQEIDDQNIALQNKIDQQDQTLQTSIDGLNSKIDDKTRELQTNIDTLSKNSSINFNAHVDNKNNPHEVTASQLNVYTKDESDEQKKDVENQIKAAQSSAFLEVDKTEELEDNTVDHKVWFIDDIADVEPTILYVTIEAENEDELSNDGSRLGHFILQTALGSVENHYDIFTIGTHKLIYEDKIYENMLAVDWYNDCGYPINVSVSYLKQSELLKLLDYIDFTMGGNLISSGTQDPDETITSQFYFKYSE